MPAPKLSRLPKIDPLPISPTTSIADLVQLMRDKNYTGMRKWVAENIDQDQNAIYRKLYDQSSQFLKPQTVPLLVLAVAKYSYQAAFAADPEITMMACLTEIMINCEFT